MADDNKRTGKVPASVYGEAHTPESLEDIRQKFGRKVKMPNGTEMRSTWYQPSALTSEPTNEMSKSAFEDHVKHAKRSPAATLDDVQKNRRGDETLRRYLKELGREPSSLKSVDWGAAERGKVYTTADLDMIRSAEGRRVVMPNGHVLQTTWYSNPSTAGLTEWEKKQIAKSEAEYLKAQGEKIAARTTAAARERYGNVTPAAVAPAVPATKMTSNERLAQFLHEKDGRGANNVAGKPAKTVSAPRGMDGLTRAERKAKAGRPASVSAAPVSTPAGASNSERFRATYERALTEQIKANPSRYAYGVDRAPEIARRMTEALATGQGDHTSPTVKATAKAMGVKPTVGGLKSFLGSSKLGMAVAIGSTALGLVSAFRSSPAAAAAPADGGKTRTKPYTDSAGREYRNGRLIVRPST